MKSFNKITIALIFIISFSSCNEEFLDKNPNDQISSATFWATEADIDMAVAGCYSSLKGSFLDFSRGYLDGLTDGAYVHWNYHKIDDLAMGNINPSTGGVISITYNGLYRGIAQCNYFLANVDKATEVDTNILNKAKAEVRFLRALFYFDLVNYFGEVPLYEEQPLSAEESKVTKSPITDIYTFIHSDLDFAISNLPEETYTGHAVKGSAKGIKVRVLLTQERWSEAATLANEIITSGTFSLYDDYPNMFINAGQESNNEIMFACEYLSPDAHSVYGMNIEYAKHIFLTPELKNAYECTDGLPIDESPLYDPNNTFANRDPRHEYVIRNPVGTDWEGHYNYNFYDVTGVQNRKGIDPSIPGNYAFGYLNDWDFILLRYADILLMYAEAQNEANGPDQSVYDAINEVRTRPSVNMPPVDEVRYATQDQVRDYIRHERFVEFPVEGIRYFDLKRWGIIDEIQNQRSNAAGVPYSFEQKHYKWPFPQQELDANENLAQTTGYSE